MTYLHLALKRIFSGKFESSASWDQPELVALPPDISFPPPAFIRPQHKGMAAREERYGRRALGKCKIAPNVTTSQPAYAEMLQSPSEQQPEPWSTGSREAHKSPQDQSRKLSPSLATLNLKPRTVSTQIPLDPSAVALQRHSRRNDSSVQSLDSKRIADLPHRASPTRHENSDLAASANVQPYSQPSLLELREPELIDFLSLSDNDVAEPTYNSTSPLSKIPALDLRIPSSRLLELASSLSTLKPPDASDATKAAALETARIANLYDLDLAYFVNLCPTGQLLAAYGLEHLPPSNVDVAAFGSNFGTRGPKGVIVSYDFAWGYACVFYPCRCNTSKSKDLGIYAPGGWFPENLGHGIVFAAYRRPKGDARRTEQYSKAANNSDLHRDAVALVQKFIKI